METLSTPDVPLPLNAEQKKKEKESLNIFYVHCRILFTPGVVSSEQLYLPQPRQAGTHCALWCNQAQFGRSSDWLVV